MNLILQSCLERKTKYLLQFWQDELFFSGLALFPHPYSHYRKMKHFSRKTLFENYSRTMVLNLKCLCKDSCHRDSPTRYSSSNCCHQQNATLTIGLKYFRIWLGFVELYVLFKFEKADSPIGGKNVLWY